MRQGTTPNSSSAKSSACSRKPAKGTTAGTTICRHRKKNDREHRKQKRAEETTPERKQRLQAVKEYVRFKSRIASQSPTELQHSFYPSKNSKVMKNKNTGSPFTDRIHFLVRLCSWARQSAKIPCLVWMCGMWTTNCFADERKTIFILFDFWIRTRQACLWNRLLMKTRSRSVRIVMRFCLCAYLENSPHEKFLSRPSYTRNNLSLHFTDPWPVLLLSATRRRSDIECLGCELGLCESLFWSPYGGGVCRGCTLASMMTFCPQQPNFFLQSTCFPAGWITMWAGKFVNKHCNDKEMYVDFSDFKKSYDFLMKLEIDAPYLLVVVSCVDLKPLGPVSVVEITGGEGRERLFRAAFFVAIWEAWDGGGSLTHGVG